MTLRSSSTFVARAELVCINITVINESHPSYFTAYQMIEWISVQEAAAVNIEPKTWPPFFDTDDLPKKKLHNLFRMESPEELCYIDFSVSTTGMLTGAKVIVTL